MRNLLAVLLLLSVLASCVPNKKVTYLQRDDVRKTDMPRDSVVRTYNIEQYDYKIQSQDILSIRFESLTDEEFDFLHPKTQNTPIVPGFVGLIGEMVNEEGEVNYPVLGRIKVAGLTIFQAQDTLQKIANVYLESPKVVVRLVNFRVTVLGEVNGEKQVTLTNNRVNILEAIGLAGGMGELADRSRVKIIRQTGGIVEVQYINLLEEDVIMSPYYYVHQNDVIIVPPLNQRAFRRYFGPNLALIASSLSILLLSINFINSRTQ